MSARGLGFAVARDLVRRMGSELRARRPPEGGLELGFDLRLPEAG
jgi:K+-sensing histidine kinase KdpD